jgi:flagellar biosynthesis/type III secretory pathway chaperone
LTARDRIAALDELDARELCSSAESTLQSLVEIMNEETTLLRAGHFRQASALTGHKTTLAQEYVSLARTVQRQLPRLRLEAPEELESLESGHDRLATQMAENLRVIAAVRDVTQTLLTDVAVAVGGQNQPKTYDAHGELAASASSARGLSINRAL